MANATRFRFRLITALLMGTVSLSAQAKAQEAAAPTPGSTNQTASANEDEVIVVTAQRREQQLTDVGISITALPEKVIEESRISQIENIAEAVYILVSGDPKKMTGRIDNAAPFLQELGVTPSPLVGIAAG